MPNKLNIKYPRRIFIRSILIRIGKILIRILTNIKISGIENFPINGPLIVAGNHVASLEALLMVVFTPTSIELLGTGDIPLDPNLAGFARLYGYIPIFRGSIDQTGLKTALSVLEQNGVIGIFPEGGIWDTGKKQAKIGVSWLSYKSGAPVIPVGFVGMKNSLKNALLLKKPKIEMIIGEPLKAEEIFLDDQPLKQKLLNTANLIMEKIYCLLPESELINHVFPESNQVNLKFQLKNYNSNNIESIDIQLISALSFLLNQPVLMDVFARNLKLPVKGLIARGIPVKLGEYINGCNSILNYLDTNPGFLSYRFGIEKGLAMKYGLIELTEKIRENEHDFSEIIVSNEISVI